MCSLSLSLKIRHNAHVEVRWKLTGACILLPPCGSWEVSSGHQAEQQKPSLTEPSHCPSLEYLPVLDSPLVVALVMETVDSEPPAHRDFCRRPWRHCLHHPALLTFL